MLRGKRSEVDVETKRMVLVTGANGFIGHALCARLIKQGIPVRMTGQTCPNDLVEQGGEWFQMPDLSGQVEWGPALEGVTEVVHLAGMAHRLSEDQGMEADGFDRVNHRATRSLALSLSAHTGMNKFLFISSVAVHGEPKTFPLRADHPLMPCTPYGKSKMDAETAIGELMVESRCKWAIFRPVLVYGPGNPGNLARLDGLIRRGVPVPVGQTPNRRSFLFLGNLVDAICAYLEATDPPSGKAYLVADAEIHSTADLVLAMAAAKGIKVRVWPLPEAWLNGMARIGDGLRHIGLPCPWNSEVRKKLLGDFFVETDPIRADLSWGPPFTLRDGLAQTYR
jgi:nucleoside-diphosphate-sugar epimerase